MEHLRTTAARTSRGRDRVRTKERPGNIVLEVRGREGQRSSSGFEAASGNVCRAMLLQAGSSIREEGSLVCSGCEPCWPQDSEPSLPRRPPSMRHPEVSLLRAPPNYFNGSDPCTWIPVPG